jgi:hypothetical protein
MMNVTIIVILSISVVNGSLAVSEKAAPKINIHQACCNLLLEDCHWPDG